MKIKDEEIDLKITPRGIQKVEEKYKEFDILGIIRSFMQDKIEPRISDYYKVIYTAYITVKYTIEKKEIDIEYDDFLDYIEDIPITEISNTAIGLLVPTRKN